jgi:hypothetical protein
MSPTAIYDAVLADVEFRKEWHPKHLSNYRNFFEGIRIIKRDNGFYRGMLYVYI